MMPKAFSLRKRLIEIEANTAQSLSGCGYTLSGANPVGWMPAERYGTAAGKGIKEEPSHFAHETAPIFLIISA